MNSERILSLDISTKTGWASIVSSADGVELESYGTVPQIHEPDGTYPESYVTWAYLVYGEIEKLIETWAPDVLVIEETVAGSKAVYTQKILEWIHFLVARFIKETSIRAIYLLTGAWRSETGCVMTKEESKHNKAVKAYKDQHGGSVAYNESGKRIGRLTKKHVNIRRANEVFGKFLRAPLRKKDEDTADSLLLAYCYHLRRIKNEQRSV